MGIIKILSPPPVLSLYKPNVTDLSADTEISKKLSISNLDASLNFTAKSIDLGEIGDAFSKLRSIKISGLQNRLSHLEVNLPSRAMYSGTTAIQGRTLDKIF